MTLAEARAARTAMKKAHRARREAELGAKQRALPDRRYGVILADPPWRFEPFSRETGLDRSADNHYPTTPLEAIKALGRRRLYRRTGLRVVPLGDRSHASTGARRHACLGLRLQEQLRLGEGPRRHRLLEPQPDGL